MTILPVFETGLQNFSSELFRRASPTSDSETLRIFCLKKHENSRCFNYSRDKFIRDNFCQICHYFDKNITNNTNDDIAENIFKVNFV